MRLLVRPAETAGPQQYDYDPAEHQQDEQRGQDGQPIEAVPLDNDRLVHRLLGSGQDGISSTGILPRRSRLLVGVAGRRPVIWAEWTAGDAPDPA